MKSILPLLLLAACAVSVWLLTSGEEATGPGLTEPGAQEAALEEPDRQDARELQEPEAATLEREQVSTTVEPEQDQDLAQEESEEPTAPGLHTIQVRVVGPDGTPKAGVPVALIYTAIWGPQPMDRALSDDDGMVTLEEERIWGPREEVRAMHVGFPFHCKDASPPFDFQSDAWPEEPVELELPATGGVEVHLLDEDGEPWTNPVELKMAPVSMFSKKGKALREKSLANLGLEVDDGIGIFPHVGLGRRFEVGVPWDPWARWETVRVAGPKEAGEVVKVELRVQDVRPQWTVRLLHEDGKPIADREVLVQRASWYGSDGRNFSSMSHLGTFTSDADGKLKWPFSEELKGDHEELRFTAGPTGDPRFGYGTLLLMSTHAGQDQDFGELILAGPTLLASGTVQDASGNPLDAYVAAHHATYHPLDPDAAPSFDWTPGGHSEKPALGAFRAVGVTDSPLVQLKASAEGFAEKMVTVDRGSEGVTIVLHADYGIAGRLEVPDGFDPKDLMVRFLADGGPRGFDKYRGAYPHATPDAEGNFRIAEIPERVPGAVAVIDKEGGFKLALVESVVPTLIGEAGDPRLEPLVLDQVFAYAVKVVSPTGGKVRGFTWALEGELDPLQDNGNFDFGDDFGFLWTGERATVAILADGYRVTIAELQPGDNEVELLRAPLVQFEAPELPALPEGLRYSIKLDSLDGPDILDLETNLPTGAQGGVFPVPMPGTGNFQVQLSVWDRKTGASVDVLVDNEPWVFDFHISEQGGQAIHVPIPVSGVEAAVQEALAAQEDA